MVASMTILRVPKTSIPLKMVGSTVFGRYPKISTEETWNMIISDRWLVPYAGYKKIKEIGENVEARGLFNSIPLNRLVIVVDNRIYLFSRDGALEKRAEIETYTGDVFIAENDANQIAICDKRDIYILDYKNNEFDKAKTGSGDLNFIPTYITFQNGYFIAPEATRAAWRLSKINDGRDFPDEAAYVGAFQSKPDLPLAAIRMPGRGNQLFVMGSTVTECWVDVGATLFPYQRTTAFNIDYGCVNQATIAPGENFIVWLGGNEKSGLSILYSTGGSVQQISNDGINFKLAQLEHPEDSYGFLFKQDGHMLYQITFTTDNVSYVFDFTTKAFFTLTDENYNHHIAKQVAFFNNKYYFISFKDGNLYELNSIYTDWDGVEAIRRRRTPNIRLPNSSSYIMDKLSFVIEQGTAKTPHIIDTAISRDGGQTFGNNVRSILNPLGKRKNHFKKWNMGRSNDTVFQFDFWGNDRFVVGDGVLQVHGRKINESA
jgi:hypothetical protein